ncbi:MAG: peptidoglycan DD-metalloendopeptidase family protein [Ignavibacteria bacterium]|nr:peptidoglycan DD-metalloendopeptidase family protein [Ignavibacteria bacterium]
MVMRFLFLIIVLGLFSIILPQQMEIKEKNQELDGIRNEITSLEKELRSISNKEKQSAETIEKFSRQNFLINKLISSLKQEELKKDNDIKGLQREISRLEKEETRLKDNYANYVRSLYKGISKNEWSYLIGAESIQQAVLRYYYLRRFSAQRKKDLVYLEENRLAQILTQKVLQKEKKEKTVLRNAKESEEKNLTQKIRERKKILTQLKKNKTLITRDIASKKQAEKVIKSLITRLVEKEEARKREEARRREEQRKKELAKTDSKKSTFPTPKAPTKIVETEDFITPEDITQGFSSFSNLRGRLGWPVKRGSVMRKFGENKNPKLNTVTLNYGIDIEVKGDYSVFSVGEGVVSAIDWIPGYGSVLILTHKDGYRTVYGHLDRISVNEGEKVTRGQVIGQVGESLEGYILHFEIWNQRKNQNPEVWLARR